MFLGLFKNGLPNKLLPRKRLPNKRRSGNKAEQMQRVWQTRALPKGVMPLSESVEPAALSIFEATRLLDVFYIRQRNPTFRRLELLRIFRFIDDAVVNALRRGLKEQKCCTAHSYSELSEHQALVKYADTGYSVMLLWADDNGTLLNQVIALWKQIALVQPHHQPLMRECSF